MQSISCLLRHCARNTLRVRCGGSLVWRSLNYSPIVRKFHVGQSGEDDGDHKDETHDLANSKPPGKTSNNIQKLEQIKIGDNNSDSNNTDPDFNVDPPPPLPPNPVTPGDIEIFMKQLRDRFSSIDIPEDKLHILKFVRILLKTQRLTRPEFCQRMIEYFLKKHGIPVLIKWDLEKLHSILGKHLDDRNSGINEKEKEYRERLRRRTVPEDVQQAIDREFIRFRSEPDNRNYLNWLTSIPWGTYTEERFDIKHAAKVLDEDHYGLKDLKDRILEFIAIGRLRGSVKGKIICLVGPPGVGKTSVASSIARALDRKFFRITLGGLGRSDTSQIKGHRLTYVGSQPGSIINALKQLDTLNPVILLDEIDKIDAGPTGMGAYSAILEVLDPDHNDSFMDNFLGVPVDLSRILFVCTANNTDDIPVPLRDRMEMFDIPGYTPEEQVAIAKRYLVPAAISNSGFGKHEISIHDDALHEIVHCYCREPGVRNVQKHIEKIFRKLALKKVQGNTFETLVSKEDLYSFVGKPAFTEENPFSNPPPGVVKGLAASQHGGCLLFVESVVDPVLLKAQLQTSGQLRDVLKESAQIAYTFSKNYLGVVAPESRFFETAALHMHLPDGSTPKDGPSAGIAMVTSLLSLALGTPVLPNISMTGEVTITGKVLAVGKLLEKTLVAKRLGVDVMVIPKDNKSDWQDLPASVRRGIKIHFADFYDDVFDVAFPNLSSKTTTKTTTKTKMKTKTKTTTKTPSKQEKPENAMEL